MQVELNDAVAVVTGSTVGIGRAIAFALADAGAAVVVTGRRAELAQSVAAEIVDAGGRACAVAADISSEAGVDALMNGAQAEFGTIDVLVNNAGRGYIGPTVDMKASEWRKVMDLDLTAPFLCSQRAGAVMLEKGSGVIINVASVASSAALPGRTAYTTAKHGLLGLTRALAAEWGASGVRVLAVCPGYVWTDLIENAVALGKYNPTDVAARTPMGRLGTVDEVAEVVVFLASRHASYMTGSCVAIDGGWTAHGGYERFPVVDERI